MNAIYGGGIAAIAILFGLWQWEASGADKARQDKATAEAKFAAEQQTSAQWKQVAEDRAAAALDAARREGQAAGAETKTQQQLSWANAQIRRLQDESANRITESCGDVIIRDGAANQLYRDALDAVADAAPGP